MIIAVSVGIQAWIESVIIKLPSFNSEGTLCRVDMRNGCSTGFVVAFTSAKGRSNRMAIINFPNFVILF
jgi:hypothetical protein